MSLRTINGMINCGELEIHKVPIGGDLHGFVYRSGKGRAHIFIDQSLSPEGERNALLHECCHVVKHDSPDAHIIGLDCQYAEIEKEAEQYVREHQTEYVSMK